MIKKLTLYSVLFLASFCLISLIDNNSVHAASCSWNGSANTVWSNASNWGPGCSGTGGIPGNTDDLTFPQGPTTYTLNNDIIGLTLNTITIVGDSTDYYVLGGNAITLTAGMTATTENSVPTIDFDITLSQNQTFALEAVVLNSDINLNGRNLTFDLSEDNSVSTGVISGTGNITIAGDRILYLEGDNTFTGSITVTDDAIVGPHHDNSLGNSANVLTLEDGAHMYLDTYAITLSNDMVFNGFNNVVSLDQDRTLSGDITLGFNTYFSVLNSTLDISGSISGQNISKDGGGGLIFSGTASNVFTGNTILQAGTLVLSKTSPAIAAPTGISIASDGVTPTVLTQTFDDQIADNADVVLYGDGAEWNLDGHTETVNDVAIEIAFVGLGGGELYLTSLILTGGVIDSGDLGNVYVNENIYVANSPTQSFIRGHLTGLEDIEIEVVDLDSDPDIEITAEIHGADQIKFRGGETVLSGVNDYIGVTVLEDAAELLIMNPYAFGDDSVRTIINDTSYIMFYVDSFVDGHIYEPFEINGSGGNGTFSAMNSASAPILRGLITLNAAVDFRNMTVTESFHLWGVISGNHNISFTKHSGPGISASTIHNDNTFVGTVTINDEMELSIGSPDGLNGNHVVINDGGWLFVGQSGLGDGINVNVGSVSGEGSLVVLSSPDTTGSMTIGSDNTSTTFSGFLDGDGDIFKTGSGTWNLTGTSTYSGLFTINSGKVLFNGTDDYPAINLSGNGTLGGNGTVGVVTSYSGNVAPGNSPGIIHVVGDLVLSSSSTTHIELNGTTVGTEYDQIQVTEDAILADSTLSITLGYTPTIGDTFTILVTEVGGTVNGTFAGLEEGEEFSVGSNRFRINYTSSTVTLTALASPLADTGIRLPILPLVSLTILAGMVVGLSVKKKREIE